MKPVLASVLALSVSACVSAELDAFEHGPVAPDEPDIVAAEGPDTNVMLYSTDDRGTWTSTTLLASYQDWNKRYYRVVPGGVSNQALFYNRDQSYARVIRFSASGGFSTLNTIGLFAQYDEVVSGEFGGTSAGDVLFFHRQTGDAVAYEINSSGGMTLLFQSNIPDTDLGGKWDVIASGRLGHVAGWHDVLVYNKTEGVARFLRPSSTGLSEVMRYYGWYKGWDQIVPGNIDGDIYTDFLFYNQDGGTNAAGAYDSGRAKAVSFGASFDLRTISESTTAWPMTAHAIVVPGDFRGDGSTDFIAFDGSAGRATLFVNDGGALVDGGYWSWNGRWTSIVPLDVDGGQTDLLFFTTQRIIDIVPVAMNGASLANFADWVDAANEAFAPAGIQFAQRPAWSWNLPAIDTGSGCTGDASDATLNGGANTVRAASEPGTVVVFVRMGGGGVGCSDDGKEFVVMPTWTTTSTARGFRDPSAVDTDPRNPKLLAHELGHYFSLAHTQPNGPMTASPNPYTAYDNDRAPEPGFTAVWDTPASPHVSEWSVANACDDSGASDVAIAPSGSASYTLNPERHNIMSRGVNCDLLYRLTPGQIRAVRESLWDRRAYP